VVGQPGGAGAVALAWRLVDLPAPHLAARPTDDRPQHRQLWLSWAPGALALSLSFEGLGPGRDEWSHRVVPPSRVFDERHGHRVLDLLVSIGQSGGNRSETSDEIVFVRLLKLGDREAENVGYKQMQEDLFVVLEVLLQARAKSGTCFDEVRNEFIGRQGHPRTMLDLEHARGCR